MRSQSLVQNNEEGYYAIAREGIDHFTQMTESGLALPAQRHVVWNDGLYTFTERINGRELTSDPEDGALSEPVIDGLSQYYLWVFNNPKQAPRFLWDKAFAWQHTVTKGPKRVMMHDIGLQFDTTRNTLRRPNGVLYSCGLWLGEWATTAEVEYPKSLRRLLAKEPSPRRVLRKLLEPLAQKP